MLPRDRYLIRAFYGIGRKKRSAAEIAQRLGVHRNTVYYRLNHLCKHLRGEHQ